MKAKPAKHSGDVLLEVNRRDERMLTAAAMEPFRLKNILVPIDFSDCSTKALQYALPFAKQHGAAITLLYVDATPTYAAGEYAGIDYTALEADMRARAEDQLRSLATNEVRGAVRTSTMVRTGLPAAEITGLAKSLPADLIVISTHGRTGLKHAFLGSVAEQIVRHAPCPVLVVREREREFLS